MGSVLDRTHALQSCRDPFGVVPGYVVIERDDEYVDVCISCVVEHLFLEVSEEVLHDRIVEAVPLARH